MIICFFSSFVPLNENEYNWKKCRDTNIFGLVNFKSIKCKSKKLFMHLLVLYGYQKKIDEDF